MNTVENDPMLIEIQESISTALEQPTENERATKKIKVNENTIPPTSQLQKSGDSSEPLVETQQQTRDFENTTTTNPDQQTSTKFSHTNPFDILEQAPTEMEIENPTVTPTMPNIEESTTITKMFLDQTKLVTQPESTEPTLPQWD